ncbi:hypothetical protein K438DRAFT_1778969 [Mycena galopus ATCC 62051]|nr:hypothetical protein K438DRAFT_1778969 [Mycena galopus ATCC 62051]
MSAVGYAREQGRGRRWPWILGYTLKLSYTVWGIRRCPFMLRTTELQGCAIQSHVCAAETRTSGFGGGSTLVNPARERVELVKIDGAGNDEGVHGGGSGFRITAHVQVSDDRTKQPLLIGSKARGDDTPSSGAFVRVFVKKVKATEEHVPSISPCKRTKRFCVVHHQDGANHVLSHERERLWKIAIRNRKLGDFVHDTSGFAVCMFYR